MSITPGQSLTVEIACDKTFSSYGRQSSSDACPRDAGAYHAGGTTGDQSGWGGNQEENLLGCALAIAFKSDASQVQPEDFTVMSVQERCVRQRDTTFEIPANLPACPGGECTCAWFWQGKNSALEMYMTGFRCNVQGGVVTTDFPKPAPPRRGAISGPTQPMYWANDASNLDYNPEWATKPSYNSAWGWKNGAQTSAFGAGGGGGGGAPVNSTRVEENAPQPTSTQGQDGGNTGGNGEENTWVASSTSSRRRGGGRGGRRSSTSAAQGQATWYNHAAEPTGNAAKPVEEGQGSPAGCKRSLRTRKRRAHH